MVLAKCINQLPNHAVVVSVRGKATGDNSQAYIPHDTGFTADIVSNVCAEPPLLPEIKDVLVESIEEVKDNEPLDDTFRVWFGKSMPTIEDDKDPARDLVNFPRPKLVIHPEARRLFLIPDSWFRALYPKTGVTGPYVLTGGLLAFLLSKEYLIYEAEMNVGVFLCIIIGFAIRKFGPQVDAHLQNVRDTSDWLWYSWHQGSIKRLNEYIEAIKKSQESCRGQEILFDAKRENVALQREAEYRRRLQVVYDEVKRKLDYQVASDQARKQFEQNHMVSWILRSVEDAVAKQNEKEVLSKCINDLKALGVARKGAV